MPKLDGLSIHIALLLLITLLARPAAAQQASTAAETQPNTDYQLTLSTERSREGYFVVAIDQTPQTKMVLQQSASADFSAIAAEFDWFGDFTEMTLTGFSDGEYYFRLKPVAGVSSNVVQLRVEHYSQWQAYSLFFIGLFLFSVLVITLITLHLRTRRQEVA
ncbi:hypothetical protein [Pseudidiomarina homiensis]|uniref:hypothetical protein n=1 Tax=Pseudidiomarina homiensis TaxID=364198 RepID=UPI00215AC702|nr:hypothetical protein [Pseudidiomarina homiensis]